MTPLAPLEDLSTAQILFGPPVVPLDRVKLYSADDFEDFIREWAYYYLQQRSAKYIRVMRYGGSGDKGRDVVGYFQTNDGEGCDFYQCKHYDHPLQPHDAWPELAKLCYYTFLGKLRVPRNYYFTAPRDVGPELGSLIDQPDQLHARLIAKWTECGGKDLIRGKTIPLHDALLDYVRSFDFGIVKVKPILEVIDEHGTTNRRAPRFGGGLNKQPPPDPTPPVTIASHEARYVAQLLAAYGEKVGNNAFGARDLSENGHLNKHFERSRERYYCAEALRLFARDNLPESVTFAEVQEQIRDAVIDTCEAEHANGYERALATTKHATTVAITNHCLRDFLKPRSRQGMCHQLVECN